MFTRYDVGFRVYADRALISTEVVARTPRIAARLAADQLRRIYNHSGFAWNDDLDLSSPAFIHGTAQALASQRRAVQIMEARRAVR